MLKMLLYQLPVGATCPPSPGIQPPCSFKGEMIKERCIRNRSYSKAQALSQTSFAAAGLRDATCASTGEERKTHKKYSQKKVACSCFFMYIPTSLLGIKLQKTVF